MASLDRQCAALAVGRRPLRVAPVSGVLGTPATPGHGLVPVVGGVRRFRQGAFSGAIGARMAQSWLAGALVLGATACSSGALSSDPADAGGLAEVPRVAHGGPCEGGTGLTRIAGRVVDDTGMPLRGAAAQACMRLEGDRLLCLRPARTDDDGRFALDVPPEAACPVEAAARILMPGSATHATVYCHLPLAPGVTVVETEAPYVLFRTVPARLPERGDPQALRWVDFGGGLAAGIVPDALYAGGDDVYGELAARELSPDDRRACPLVDAPQFSAVFAFAPEADVQGAGLEIQLPARGLAPGTEVDLYVLGALDCTLASGEVVPEATWQRHGRAVVNGSGYIRATGASAAPCLSWLAYAPAGR